MKNLKITNNLPKLQAAIQALTKQDVLVGVPSDAQPRKKDATKNRVKIKKGVVSGGANDTVNNATIAYIQDNGSPAQNIPARPFMKPGIEKAQADINNAFQIGAKSVLNGSLDSLDVTLHRVGLIAQRSIQATITEGIPPPLSDRTLRERILANRGAIGATAELARRKAGEEPSATINAKPLLVTGQLRNSISYVIMDKS